MKDIRINISPYFLIPFVFAGSAVLCALITLRILEFLTEQSFDLGIGFILLLLVMGSGAFICGLIIIRVLLKPVEGFIENAKQVSSLPLAEANKQEKRTDRISEYQNVFDQVASVLSRVEARRLFPEIIAESRAMRGVMDMMTRVAPTDSTVLISGESGTGKELIATGVHNHSLRKDGPFIRVNCVAIPEGLWESELFGHEKGAFTGAITSKQGKFEAAEGGTIFLDEIGDMPQSTQAKILRVLQEKEFERVGSNRPIKVDMRFIAATNKDLGGMVQEGTFREDLFYRLNVFSIHLPPLRERREDIPLLVNHFLQKLKTPMEITGEALQVLIGYSWPGNIRELQNVIERASVVCREGPIEPACLPFHLVGHAGSVSPAPLTQDMTMDERLRHLEKGMIIQALKQTGGIQARSAELLGISERSLWHRLKKYEIDAKAFKA